MDNRHSATKPSGVEWIGEIPEDWGIHIIKYSTYVKGRIGWQGLKSDEFIDEGPFLVTGTDFCNGRINWQTCYHLSESRYNEAPEIHLVENDLLITKDGTIGKVSIVKDQPYKAILNSGIFLIRPLYNLYYYKYMYWVLLSPIFEGYIGFTETGSTIKHLYQEIFEGFIFPLPPFLIQKKIAFYLDQKCAEIDKVIDAKQRQNELLKEYKRAIIYEAVTGKMIINNENIEVKPSGMEWIGEIPENWRVKKLKYIASLKTGTTPSSNDTDYFDGDLNWFTPGDFSNEIVLRESSRKLDESAAIDNIVPVFPPFSILIVGIGATTGKIGYTVSEASSNQQITAIIPYDDNYYKYLVYWMLSIVDYIKGTALYTTLPILNNQTLGEVLCLVPPLPIQKYIADYLDQKCTEIDKVIENNNSIIEKLKEYRQSIIYEVVTGKTKIC